MTEITRVVFKGKECLKIKDAVLGPWRSNFEGAKNPNTGDNARCFYIRLTPEQAQELMDVDGFTNIKITKPDPDGRYEPEWYAKIKIKFHDDPEEAWKNPALYLVASNGKLTQLTPELISELNMDRTKFSKIDLTVGYAEGDTRDGAHYKSMWCNEGLFTPAVTSAWSDEYNMTDIPEDSEGGF